MTRIFPSVQDKLERKYILHYLRYILSNCPDLPCWEENPPSPRHIGADRRRQLRVMVMRRIRPTRRLPGHIINFPLPSKKEQL